MITPCNQISAKDFKGSPCRAIHCFYMFAVMTHDSIGLGEDGPTHQPIEHLASFRAMPDMLMVRPAGGNEVAGAYKVCSHAYRHRSVTRPDHSSHNQARELSSSLQMV